MSDRISVPLKKLGDSVDEVVVVEWLVMDGDCVKYGDDMVIVETNKVDVTIQAPAEGNVTEMAPVNSELRVGDQVCVIVNTAKASDGLG